MINSNGQISNVDIVMLNINNKSKNSLCLIQENPCISSNPWTKTQILDKDGILPLRHLLISLYLDDLIPLEVIFHCKYMWVALIHLVFYK